MEGENHPKVGVGVIVIKGDHVLLGKRKGSHGVGEWSFPGGHLEFKESIEACAERELEEETGLIAKAILKGPWTNTIYTDINKHYVTLFVWVHEFEGEPQLMEPHKCEGWQWFHWEKLPEPLFKPIQSLIQEKDWHLERSANRAFFREST